MLAVLGWLTVAATAAVAIGVVGALTFTALRPTFWHWRPFVPQRADELDLPSMDNYIPWI